MKPGDLVRFSLTETLGGIWSPDNDFGMIVGTLSYEERGHDPFPHFYVLYGNRGLLRCRESDLVEEKSWKRRMFK